MTDVGLITGYAALFDQPDRSGDIVRASAFDGLRPETVALLWQHQPAEPVGRILRLQPDRIGLHLIARLDIHVQRGAEALSLSASGALRGLSIGYRVIRASPRRPGPGRDLLALDLWEVSLVTFPMQPGATIRTAEPVPAGPVS